MSAADPWWCPLQLLVPVCICFAATPWLHPLVPPTKHPTFPFTAKGYSTDTSYNSLPPIPSPPTVRLCGPGCVNGNCADGMCICPPGCVEEIAVVYVCACMRTVICKHCVSSPFTCRCAQYIWINIAYSPTHLTSQRAAFGPLIANWTRPISLTYCKLELDLPPTSCEREKLVQLDVLAHR